MNDLELARTAPCPACVDIETGTEVSGVHQVRIYRAYVVNEADAHNRAYELAAEVERLTAVLDEVRLLHVDSPAGFCPSCARLSDVSDTDDGLVAYPCPTIQALNGDPLNNNDERDYVEEAANRRLLQEGDDDSQTFLIWSNQQRMWWRSNQRGYTQVIDEAGRYTRADAEGIVKKATCDGELKHHRTDPVTGVPYVSFDEVIVPAPESVEVPW